MPSRRKYSHSNGPHWLSDPYNEPNQQLKATTSQSYYDLNDIDEDTYLRDDFLYKENLHEVLRKFKNLDDGIWGKIVCLERNRRVAKAYIRYPQVTVNGSDAAFDGLTIGLSGFDNPYRDKFTKNVLTSIGVKGLTIRVDNKGNIWAENQCQCTIYVPEYNQRSSTQNNHSTAYGKDLEACQGRLTAGKSCKLFDISRFRDNLEKELASYYPDMASLQLQCISVISFGANFSNILESPSSILLINIVALDMFRTRACIFRNDSTINDKPIKESFKNVAGSVRQLFKRLASSRSSPSNRHSMLERPWRLASRVTQDENPYSSLASTASYAEADPINYQPENNRSSSTSRLPYYHHSSFNFSAVDQFKLPIKMNKIKCSTIDTRLSKSEPMPDYDTRTEDSLSTSSSYKETRQATHSKSIDGSDGWTNALDRNKPPFYPETPTSKLPLNNVFQPAPITVPVVDNNSNQSTEPDIIVDSSNSSSSTTATSLEAESTDEAENHIYSSISDSKDGKSSSIQSKSDSSESSDQYGEIKILEKDYEEQYEPEQEKVPLVKA